MRYFGFWGILLGFLPIALAANEPSHMLSEQGYRPVITLEEANKRAQRESEAAPQEPKDDESFSRKTYLRNEAPSTPEGESEVAEAEGGEAPATEGQ